MKSGRLPGAAQQFAVLSLVACSGLAHAQADDALYATGKALFIKTTPACSVCHTLKDAGAEGAVGPVLDELKPDAARVAKALRDGLGSMPSFRASLTDEQIAALARYVAKASGAAP
jgi:sulfite dehydrogenase